VFPNATNSLHRKFWKGFGAGEGGSAAEAAFQASATTLLQSL